MNYQPAKAARIGLASPVEPICVATLGLWCPAADDEPAEPTGLTVSRLISLRHDGRVIRPPRY